MSARGQGPLASAFPRRLVHLGLGPSGRLLVALSGGRDSVTLLHLLKFVAAVPAERLVAGHFDHDMRPDSRADAEWTVGLAYAWGVEHHVGAADTRPTSEAEARQLRYDYLYALKERTGASWILTAHHADDQAETVLHRALRGAGPRGLAGIREKRAPGVARPLLPFPGAWISDYARRARLSWREDPSNVSRGPARNRLRHDVLPAIEAAVAPGARKALARLGEIMAGVDESVSALADAALASLARPSPPGEIAIDREGLVSLPAAARAEVLRAAARRMGRSLDQAGTRLAVEVTSHGASGKAVDLGGGMRIGREFDLLRLTGAGAHPPDRNLCIDGPGSGSGDVRLHGRSWTACWSDAAPTSARWNACFARDGLVFPLTVRGWRPGDRIRLPYGSKKIKKLFQEARLPRSDRIRHPLVVDAGGTVVWVPRVARSTTAHPRPTEPHFHLGFDDA